MLFRDLKSEHQDVLKMALDTIIEMEAEEQEIDEYNPLTQEEYEEYFNQKDGDYKMKYLPEAGGDVPIGQYSNETGFSINFEDGNVKLSVFDAVDEFDMDQDFYDDDSNCEEDGYRPFEDECENEF